MASDEAKPALAAPENVRGMALMGLGALGVALITLLVRLVAESGLHPFVIVFFRNLVGLLFLLPLAWRAGPANFRTQRLELHALRSLLQAGAMLGWFYGLTHTSMAVVAALGFTSPLFAALLAILVLREQVGARRWTALGLGFVGTLLILRPGADVIAPAASWLIVSAFCWGSVMIVLRVLGRTETSITSTLYVGFFLAPFSLLPALTVWSWPTWPQLGLLVLIGVIASLTQLAVAEALKKAEASAVLPVDFTKLLWGALLGFLVFQETPDIATFLGGIIIFGAVMYVAYRERRLRQAARPPGAVT